MQEISISGYLTQEKLESALRSLMGPCFIGREQAVGNTRKRWDMLIELPNEKCAVEFDGEGHYCVPNTILSDEEKDAYAASIGMRVVRIPYFVQLTSQTLRHFLGIDAAICQTYPHGFIDSKAKLPAAFCELGIHKFKAELSVLPTEVSEKILNSIRMRLNTTDCRLLLPPYLMYLLE